MDEIAIVARSIIDATPHAHTRILALSILPDHVHVIVTASDEDSLAQAVRKLKGSSAHAVRQRRGARGSGTIWAQKFNRRPLRGDRAIEDTAHYVRYNHLKHQARWGVRFVEEWEQRIWPVLRDGCELFTDIAPLARGARG